MGLHVYVKFGTDADFTEITSYVRYNSVKFDIKLMNDKFKSVQDSVKMQTIYDATLNARFFESTAWIPAYITYDLQTEQMYGYDASSEYGYGSDAYGFLSVGNVFTGAIYPTTKDTYKSVPTEGVSFELVDNSYLLEVDCPAFAYQDFKVFDPADTSHSIIHQLLYSAGLVDASISSINTVSKTVGYISYEAKDETIDKIIDDILYEYHHTYYFNEDGQFCLYDWKHDSITLAGTITDAVIKDKDGIKRERNIYEFDGYLVKYNELLSKTDALVYREDIPAEGELLIPSQAFPVDGEIKTIKQSYSNKWLSDDAKILLTSNHALTLTADAGITKPVETFENLEAQVVIKNTDSVDHRFYQFDIRADVVYTDKENEFTIPTTATLTDDDMELEHVYNDADALEFANALYNNTVRYGLHTYEFKSEASFDVGLCYELEHYSVNVLVIGKKYNQYEHIFEYECLSVGAQVVEMPDVLYRLPSGTSGDAPSRYLALEADFNSIDVSARGAILVPTITFKARVLGIPISEVSWSRSDAGSLGLVGGNDYLRTLDTSTVAGEFVTITITATYGGTAYNATYTVKKVYQNPVPHNFGGVTTVPNDYNGEPLIAGDYFLWAGETDGTYTKGKIYIHTGVGWRAETASDGNLVMTLFDDFSKLANDVDSTVIGNAVIKNLTAINAFIQNFEAENITAGTGNGTTGGFRFRAKSRTDLSLPYNATTNPSVFDVMYDDRKVFEVDPENGNIMFGNYNPSTKSGGILYDYVNDKLLGNVAYDQWDLVIESDADLALLEIGKAGIYENVLITQGTFYIKNFIDLELHGVRHICGINKQFCILSVDFDVYGIYDPLYVIHLSPNILVENFAVTLGPNGANFNGRRIIGYSKTGGAIITIQNIHIYGFDGVETGIDFYAAYDKVSINSVIVEDCRTGISRALNITGCTIKNCVDAGLADCFQVTACKISNCTTYGIVQCGAVSSISINNCGVGCYNSHGLSSIRVADCTTGISQCSRISSCTVSGGTTGIVNGSYISSTVSSSWGSGNTKVDSDSCNN